MAYLHVGILADPRCACGYSHSRRATHRADIELAIADLISHANDGNDHRDIFVYLLTQVTEYAIWTAHWDYRWYRHHQWGVYGLRPARYLLERQG